MKLRRLLPLGVFVVVAAPAASAPTWQPPLRISPADRALGPELAVNAAGDAVVVWDHEQGVDCPTQPASLSCIHIVEAAIRPRGTSAWQAPIEVARPGIGAAPKVALDAAGDAAISWIHDIGDDRVLQATIKPAGAARWPNANDLSGTPRRIRSHEIRLDAAGDAVAVWAQRDGDNFYVVGDLRPAAGGVWLAPVALSGLAADTSSGPALAVVPSGDALVAWVDAGAVRVAHGQAATGTWDAALTPAAGGVGSDTDVAVALDAAGDAVLAWSWRRTSSGPAVVQAAFRPAGGNWGAAVDLGAAGTGRSHVQVALNDAGSAAAVWLDGTSLRAAGRARSSGNWSLATTIATNVAPDGATVAMNTPGNAVAVWTNKATGAVRAALRPAGGAWQPPIRISAPASASPRVQLDAASRAVAVWNRTTATNVVPTETSDLQPTGPLLTKIVVPITARTGTRTSFSVAPRAWSAPLSGPPSWRFGDGKSAVGARVSHTYSRSGAYTVTVSQRDATGRTSTATRRVTVSH